MTPTILDRIFARVFESDIVQGPFTVVWHAGEPMVLPPAFYEHAVAIIARHNRAALPVNHSLQTNGTLIDADWCAFIKRHRVRIGVSIDGPAFLNDTHRTTRGGKGTFDRTMDGMRRLQDQDIPFHVITVLTGDALDYPDELYAFYVEHGLNSVGFNIEEIEGPNQHSSLGTADVDQRFRRFVSRFFDLVNRGGGTLHVREFDSIVAAILYDRDAALPPMHETTPFAIVSVDYQGNFSSFSPELLGLSSPRYGDFSLGNVCTHSFADASTSPRFLMLSADIAAGVDRCRTTCPYFRLCGGGAPVNKYYENGSFDSTETLFCRLNRKAMLEVLLGKLEAATGPASSAPHA